jgi:hypothetical protein
MSRAVKAVLGVVVVLGLTAVVGASTPTIVVGTYYLQENQAGQTIEIYVTGGDDVQGLEFNVQIGGGTAGPTFEDVDILSSGSGTIFESNNTGINPGSYVNPWYAYMGTTTSSGFVSADGLLAILTVDTTGLYDGEEYSLSLINSPEGRTNFAGVYTDILEEGEGKGTIKIIPEPTTMMIILAGSGLLIRRRRNKNRH